MYLSHSRIRESQLASRSERTGDLRLSEDCSERQRATWGLRSGVSAAENKTSTMLAALHTSPSIGIYRKALEITILAEEYSSKVACNFGACTSFCARTASSVGLVRLPRQTTSTVSNNGSLAFRDLLRHIPNCPILGGHPKETARNRIVRTKVPSQVNCPSALDGDSVPFRKNNPGACVAIPHRPIFHTVT